MELVKLFKLVLLLVVAAGPLPLTAGTRDAEQSFEERCLTTLNETNPYEYTFTRAVQHNKIVFSCCFFHGDGSQLTSTKVNNTDISLAGSMNRDNILCDADYINGTVQMKSCQVDLEQAYFSEFACIYGGINSSLFTTFCRTPTPPDHGKVQCTLWNDTSDIVRNCTFWCDPGFVLKGPPLQTCREDGTYQPEIPPHCDNSVSNESGNDTFNITGPGGTEVQSDNHQYLSLIPVAIIAAAVISAVLLCWWCYKRQRTAGHDISSQPPTDLKTTSVTSSEQDALTTNEDTTVKEETDRPGGRTFPRLSMSRGDIYLPSDDRDTISPMAITQQFPPSDNGEESKQNGHVALSMEESASASRDSVCVHQLNKGDIITRDSKTSSVRCAQNLQHFGSIPDNNFNSSKKTTTCD